MTTRPANQPCWLHVMYTDRRGNFHSEYWACTFAQAEQRLREIGATHWEIGV